MFKKLMGLAIVVLVIASFVLVVSAQDSETTPPLMDDFETEELFAERDEFNNAIGHVEWGDTAGNVDLSLEEIEREGEMTNALAISYDINSWGGFTHALTNGENWISQDWTAFNALQFWLFGNNTGGTVQVEVFDNRNPDLNTDTAERWFYRITDDFEGWQQFTIPFESFQRRTDFQPSGAPNDGLGLDAVSGYAFGMPGGVGAHIAYLDDVTLVTLDTEPLMIDDFESEELFNSQDSFGNGIGYITWGDTAGNTTLRLIDAQRGSTDTRALAVNYDISAFGGFSHVFTDGEKWISQDWTDYNAISMWVLGSNTGEEVQFEIFDNRNPDLDGDSAERWFFRFVDDSFSWKLVEIPFVEFERRSDWQPGGALDDGLNLNTVSGYAFSMPVAVGNKVLVIDDIRIIMMDGVDMPEGVIKTDPAEEANALPAIELPEVEPNPEFLSEMPFADPILIADFESGLPQNIVEGTVTGFLTWGDSLGNAVIGTTQVSQFSPLSFVDQDNANQVMRIDYNISSWGGFDHRLTEGNGWAPQDWSNHNAFQFWLYGNNTGQPVPLDIFDNRNPDDATDTAERWRYVFLDDYEGWQRITIPFAFFQRRTDWQPGSAPDDGFGLTEINGYAIGFPAGVGEQTAYLDNVQVVVVEDPTQVERFVPVSEEVTEIEIDESITWDSREWELLWSDEFTAVAGAPLSDEYWDCEIGGFGWGNNRELQYYTDNTENVSHDGDGNLVITALPYNMSTEITGEETCTYGECEYTSGRCTTQNKMQFTHGRVEARIRIPTGQGVWPAFWMLGSNIGIVDWPTSGEIDIMENVGHETNTVHGTIHGPGYSGGDGIGASYTGDVAFADDFHVYAIDWDPYVIRWYVDGELYNVISVNEMFGREWVFENDFFILLNVAVGGQWPGYPDETTEFPQQMLVDYVRVYQLAE